MVFRISSKFSHALFFCSLIAQCVISDHFHSLPLPVIELFCLNFFVWTASNFLLAMTIYFLKDGEITREGGVGSHLTSIMFTFFKLGAQIRKSFREERVSWGKIRIKLSPLEKSNWWSAPEKNCWEGFHYACLRTVCFMTITTNSHLFFFFLFDLHQKKERHICHGRESIRSGFPRHNAYQNWIQEIGNLVMMIGSREKLPLLAIARQSYPS